MTQSRIYLTTRRWARMVSPEFFFKACWGTIKEDLMKVIALLSNLHFENFHWLNSVNIVLVPKKDRAESISDFRPIKLIHAVAKIVTKMMAIRLAPFMNTLILRSQCAFIKSTSIHDNYLYVRNYARRHTTRKTAIGSRATRSAFKRWCAVFTRSAPCTVHHGYVHYPKCTTSGHALRVFIDPEGGHPLTYP
jgi:hypothetical protein